MDYSSLKNTLNSKLAGLNVFDDEILNSIFQELRESLDLLLENKDQIDIDGLNFSFDSLLSKIDTTPSTSSLQKNTELYNQFTVHYKDEIEKLRLDRQKNLSLATQNFLKKKATLISKKESLPKEKQLLIDNAFLVKQKQTDSLQKKLYDNNQAIDLKLKTLEDSFSSKQSLFKKNYDSGAKRSDSALQKEKLDFTKKESSLKEELEVAKSQSNENYISIKQTYNQASINFNKKINDLKEIVQSNLKNLNSDYEKQLQLFAKKETAHKDSQTTILNQANLEYQNTLGKHNIIFDELKNSYEQEKSKIDFEYHNKVSISTSKMNSYRDQTNDQIKQIQKEKSTQQLKNITIKNLNKSINRSIMKSNDSLRLHQKEHQKKHYQNELSYLKKLENWRFEQYKLDLEHKQSLLILENETTIFNERLTLEKTHLNDLYKKHTNLYELSHLNNISPLELQLRISSNIQDRESALLVNDSNYIESTINFSIEKLKNNHQYKSNAIEYQSSIYSFTKEYNEKTSILNFQLENEKLKREREYYAKETELKKEVASVDYDLSILEKSNVISKEFFDISSSQESINNTYQVHSIIEKELYSQSVILINQSAIISKEKKRVYEQVVDSKQLLLVKQSAFDLFSDLTMYFFDTSSNLVKFYNEILVKLDTLVKNNSSTDSYIKLVQKETDSFKALEGLAKDTLLDKLSIFVNFLINDLVNPQYHLLYEYHTNNYNYQLSLYTQQKNLIKRKLSLKENNLAEKEKLLETTKSDPYKLIDRHQISAQLLLKKHIKEDQKAIEKYKQDLYSYEKKEILLASQLTETLASLKSEHLYLIKMIDLFSNDFEKHITKTEDYFFSQYNILNQRLDHFKTHKIESFTRNLSKKIISINKKTTALRNKAAHIILTNHHLISNYLSEQTKVLSFSLLTLEDSLKCSDNQLRTCKSEIDKDKSYLLYQTNSELDIIQKFKHSELISTFEKNKNELLNKKLSLENQLENNHQKFHNDIELINENLKLALNTLSIEYQNEISLLNNKLKSTQVKLTETTSDLEKDLKSNYDSLERKNSLIIIRFNALHKRDLNSLKESQKSYKKKILQMNLSIEDSKQDLHQNLKLLKRTNYRTLLQLKKSFSKKILISKKEINQNYHKELHDLRKSQKFKQRYLK